jgi:hypothetical protein
MKSGGAVRAGGYKAAVCLALLSACLSAPREPRPYGGKRMAAEKKGAKCQLAEKNDQTNTRGALASASDLICCTETRFAYLRFSGIPTGMRHHASFGAHSGWQRL